MNLRIIISLILCAGLLYPQLGSLFFPVAGKKHLAPATNFKWRTSYRTVESAPTDSLISQPAKAVVKGVVEDETLQNVDSQGMEQVYAADYRFLPKEDPVSLFVQKRLSSLLYDVAPEEVPTVRVLASQGEGVNAFVMDNGTVILSPELIASMAYVEEIDFVLLHELNHWFREHFKRSKEARKKKNPLLASIGASRFQEYEADTAAFIQMADPKRQTNPEGAIEALEKLRSMEEDSGTQVAWDLEHGETTDRILNLKALSRFKDVFNDKELTFLDEEVTERIYGLPEGGRLSRLLQKPPSDPDRLDQWQEDVSDLLNRADWALTTAVLTPLANKVYAWRARADAVSLSSRTSLGVNQITYLSYQSVFKKALQRWEELLMNQAEELSEAEQARLIIAQLELAAGFPVFSNPNHPYSQLVKYNVEVRDFQRSFKTIEDLRQSISTIHSSVPFLKPGNLYPFIQNIAHIALTENAVFDTSEGDIDFEAYINFVDWAMNEVETTAVNRGFSKAYFTQDDKKDFWTHILFEAMLFAHDLGQWEQLKSRLPQIIESKNIRLNGNLFQILATKNRVEFTEAVDEIETYYSENIEDSEKIKKQVQKVGSHLNKLYKIPITRLSYKKKTHQKILRDIALQLDQLPEQDYPVEIVKQIVSENFLLDKVGAGRNTVNKELFINLILESIFKFYDIDNIRKSGNIDGALSLLHLVQLSSEKLPAYTVDIFKIMTREQLDLIRELKQAFLNPGEASKNLQVDLEPKLSSVDMTKDPVANYYNSVYFVGDLSENLDSDLFVYIEKYLKVLPLVEPTPSVNKEEYADDLFNFNLGRHQILEEGLQQVLTGKTPGDLTVDELKKLYLLSYFVSDITLKRPLQEYLLSRLLEEMDFMKFNNFVFEEFGTQQPSISLAFIETLDAKAETPEEIELLKSNGEKLLQSAQTGESTFGAAVLAEGFLVNFTKSDQRFKFLTTLLNTYQGDRDLRELLSQVWYFGKGREQVAEKIDELLQELVDVEDYPKIKTFQPKPDSENPEKWRQRVYRLGLIEKYALLRKLLTGQDGILATQDGRSALLNQFLKTNLDASQQTEVANLVHTIFGTFMTTAPDDELYLMLEQLLADRIARPPSQPSNWKTISQEYADNLMTYDDMIQDTLKYELRDTVTDYLEDSKGKEKAKTIFDQQDLKAITDHSELEHDEIVLFHLIKPQIERMTEILLNGGNPAEDNTADTDAMIERLTESRKTETDAELLSPIELVLEVAQKLGAPGVRFLQLLGQVVEIPEEYREKFFYVYDALKGQSKVSAWETIQRELPEYAAQVKRVGRKLGGGSLFTVFEVELNDNTTEVVRVLNPNALYHTRNTLSMMRDTIQALIEKDAQYTRVLPLLQLLEDWIVEELNDPNFAQDDTAFRAAWNNWQPEGFASKVKVPDAIYTGTRYVHREAYVPGRNLTELKKFNPYQQKELVALAVQHYFRQIAGDFSAPESRVHSDVSPGNLRVTPAGDLAILDRGMYLHFNLEERMQLLQIVQQENPRDKIFTFLNWAWELPENAAIVEDLNQFEVIQAILEKVAPVLETNPEEALFRTLVVLNSYNLRVPLKFNLLFKNLNVLNRMSKEVGFASLQQALLYVPGKQADIAEDLNTTDAAERQIDLAI